MKWYCDVKGVYFGIVAAVQLCRNFPLPGRGIRHQEKDWRMAAGKGGVLDIIEIIMDAVLDSVKLIPFLFLTYLAMEYLEHKAGEGTRRLMIRMGQSDRGKAGRIAVGPVAGGLLGVVPQCGFSAAASNLYAGRVITLGTLMAVYLSTSDEMLPLLLSERAPANIILGILAVKAVTGMAVGLAVDLVRRKRGIREQECIHDICEQENCHCEKGIFRSALSHTLQIAFFILVITFALNLLLHFMGEELLESLILNRPVLAPVLAGVIGLIPNCAGSVVLTQLYLKGAMGAGALMAGLFANSGVGLLVLFRVNHDKRENLAILGMLYGIGVAAGMMIGLAAVH